MTQRSLKLIISKAEFNLPITAFSLPIRVLVNGINLPVDSAALTVQYPHDHIMDISQHSLPSPLSLLFPSFMISAVVWGIILNATLLFLLWLKVFNSCPLSLIWSPTSLPQHMNQPCIIWIRLTLHLYLRLFSFSPITCQFVWLLQIPPMCQTASWLVIFAPVLSASNTLSHFLKCINPSILLASA